MSWFVYVILVGVDEPTPERQSAVRDHVMRRLQEPKPRLSRDTTRGWGTGSKGGVPQVFRP